MKHVLKTIIRNVKSVKGNSLAEFATTTALMATLAATAAPKLSEMSEGAKGEKSRNEIDKIIKQAGQFYQDTADQEGRGRFPGQEKFDDTVPGRKTTDGTSSTSAAHNYAGDNQIGAESGVKEQLAIGLTDTQLDNYEWTSSYAGNWASVFGTSTLDAKGNAIGNA